MEDLPKLEVLSGDRCFVDVSNVFLESTCLLLLSWEDVPSLSLEGIRLGNDSFGNVSTLSGSSRRGLRFSFRCLPFAVLHWAAESENPFATAGRPRYDSGG